MSIFTTARGGLFITAGLPGAVALCLATAAQAAPPAPDAALQDAWRDAIAATPTPHEGCFKAAFPQTAWTEVACRVAPKRPYLPRRGGGSRTVGNGADYAAVTTNLTKSATGSFPAVTGVKSETGYGGAPNTYSLQLNSDFMSTAACNSASCQSWEQFVYSSSSQAAFMQYWLIGYGNTCPSSAWYSYQGDCYTNSNAVSVPQLPIKDLNKLKISATAVKGGIDTLVLTTPGQAYSTTGQDSVVYLATAWKGSEFNIVGDGGGSQANFNKGSSVTVKIAVKHSNTTAPQCASNKGTTGETNNLNLGSCSAVAGNIPYVMFSETN